MGGPSGVGVAVGNEVVAVGGGVTITVGGAVGGLGVTGGTVFTLLRPGPRMMARVSLSLLCTMARSTLAVMTLAGLIWDSSAATCTVSRLHVGGNGVGRTDLVAVDSNLYHAVLHIAGNGVGRTDLAVVSILGPSRDRVASIQVKEVVRQLVVAIGTQHKLHQRRIHPTSRRQVHQGQNPTDMRLGTDRKGAASLFSVFASWMLEAART